MSEVPENRRRFRLRPIDPDFKTGTVGVILLLTALAAFALKWRDIIAFLNPNNQWLNWRFVVALIILTNCIIWFFMHALWRREFTDRNAREYDVENLREQLNHSEKMRMIDTVTGVPNGARLTDDLPKFFSGRRGHGEIQIILIDIKNFRRINKEHGFLKGDEVLRMIAQRIFTSMRRAEEMYKHPASPNETRSLWKTLYRRYPGGDEFIFVIDGDQSAAIGFANRLVRDFESFTKSTVAILGTEFPLSFHAAIAPLMRGDTAKDALGRVEDCYMRAAEGTGKFTLCWSPTSFEQGLDADDKRHALYAEARKNFETMNVEEHRET